MKNRVCDVLGIRYPVIQGPMAWASTAPLVAAVSNAGGLGVLGVGFAPAGFIREQVKKTRALTDKPFAMNLCIEHENKILDEVSELAIELNVPVIYADTVVNLDEELCRKYFSVWKEHGIKIIVKASILQDAVIARRAGADLIVVKGWEAGGHVSYESTMVITPLTVDTLDCPVIASGGICDGRTAAAAFALGAEGLEIGSAFLMTEECDVHPNVKTAIINSGDMDTIVTGSPTDEPCRQLKNPFSEKVMEIEYSMPKKEAAPILRELCASSLKKAMAEGDMVDGAVMVGQNASRLNEVKLAEELMREIIRECMKTVATLPEQLNWN